MKSKIAVGLLTLGLLLAPQSAKSATTTIGSSAAIAPAISFSAPVNIDFGELTVPDSTIAGSYQLDELGGPATPVNSVQIGTTALGSITITGRKLTNVNFAITPGAFTCDTTYLPACVGTASLTLNFTHTFGTQIDTCVSMKCDEIVAIGGTFGFPAGAEGKWTNTVTITANYQ